MKFGHHLLAVFYWFFMLIFKLVVDAIAVQKYSALL